MLDEYPRIRVPGVNVLGKDRVLAIHETGVPDIAVDWLITGRTEELVGHPLVLLVAVSYETPDGATGSHEFEAGAEEISVAIPRGMAVTRSAA